ncbi:putative tryptophanyl-tRNA synthetase, cytoplasmic [Aulographum hederae CBS 113979]|uniref:Tryptophan--tRNA ligase, cytoplasmic n=1 Tax=Aulographum hederae CBS 113979 TaxID=1176131 RepID=A0A6G1GNV9_9PEZI|nr:putative tryptophanyl-tRNA synthetase, cytoplasmic [Aulographum hederae CBS 113979]
MAKDGPAAGKDQKKTAASNQTVQWWKLPTLEELGQEYQEEQKGKVKKNKAQEIDPWTVEAATDEHGQSLAFDYEAISREWATKLIDQPLLDRFEALTGKRPHMWLRRGLFFSHRDLDRILDCYERGDDFFLYTGRGPSSDSMHIGHTISFEFTKWLQDVFDVPLVVMLTDDEKALFKEKLTFEEVMEFARQNAKDIISFGFDVKKTFIYSDLKYIPYNGGHMMLNAWEFSKLVNFNQVRGAFGFNGSTSTGRIFFPSLQCVAAFATSYPHIWGDDPDSDFRSKKTAAIPCLIPCGVDQDPYFRLVRENAGRMKNKSPKPALLHAKFFSALQGPGGKMSASIPNSAIFMSDTMNQIKKKINSYAFSGGQETKELQQELGGNPDVDVSYQYITYFDDDDEKIAKIADDYRKGKLLTGELKAICIKLLQEYVKRFQDNRAKVTDDVMKSFMTPRKLEWKGNPNPKKPESKQKVADRTKQAGSAGAEKS